MAQPICIVVPGVMGSHLAFSLYGGRKTNIWLSYLRLRLLEVRHMTLNAEGTAPLGTTFKDQLTVNGILEDYYGTLTKVLRAWFFTVHHAYDWRKSIVDNASGLHSRIINEFANQEVYLVGFSMGGLVAGACYKLMAAQNQEAQIKRVAFLGTPFGGSYRIGLTFARWDPNYKAVYRLMTAVSGAALLTDTQDVLDKAIASWPGMYELLPHLDGGGSEGDPLRPFIYQQATWENINSHVKASHLQSAKESQTFLSGLAPPQPKMVNIVGNGKLTPFKLDNPNDVAKVASYSWGPGDGAVPSVSSEISTRPRLKVNGEHSALPRHPWVLAFLPQLLLNGLEQSSDIPGAVVE